MDNKKQKGLLLVFTLTLLFICALPVFAQVDPAPILDLNPPTIDENLYSFSSRDNTMNIIIWIATLSFIIILIIIIILALLRKKQLKRLKQKQIEINTDQDVSSSILLKNKIDLKKKIIIILLLIDIIALAVIVVNYVFSDYKWSPTTEYPRYNQAEILQITKKDDLFAVYQTLFQNEEYKNYCEKYNLEVEKDYSYPNFVDEIAITCTTTGSAIPTTDGGWVTPNATTTDAAVDWIISTVTSTNGDIKIIRKESYPYFVVSYKGIEFSTKMRGFTLSGGYKDIVFSSVDTTLNFDVNPKLSGDEIIKRWGNEKLKYKEKDDGIWCGLPKAEISSFTNQGLEIYREYDTKNRNYKYFLGWTFEYDDGSAGALFDANNGNLINYWYPCYGI